MRLWKQRRLQDQLGWVADKIRERGARDLSVEISAEEVRRGGQLEATLTVDGPAGEDPLEVGLVCTETYADFMPSSKLSVSDKRMLDAVAFEHWVAVSAAEPQQTVTLEIPADAPYSYQGENLHFEWRVCARRRKRALDAVASRNLRVLP